MATKEEFATAMCEIGGRREHRFPRLARTFRRLGGSAVLMDIFDATVINVAANGYTITPRLEQRVYTPIDNREAAWEVLWTLGVQSFDTYTQEGAGGNQWTQLTLVGDPEFRRYAATRRLLDTAPEEGGLVEISAESLSLAVNGRSLAE